MVRIQHGMKKMCNFDLLAAMYIHYRMPAVRETSRRYPCLAVVLGDDAVKISFPMQD
jgi:hypothetical protein